MAPLLDCRVVSWREFLAEIRKVATPAQVRMLPEDSPEVVVKTKLPPIYPPGYDLSRFPSPRKLAELYLSRLGFLSIPG